MNGISGDIRCVQHVAVTEVW